MELSLNQARILAVEALNAGRPGFAIQLGKGLLKADHRDAQAYYLIAAGYARLNDPVMARRAAGYAYRFARPGADRYQSAQLASRMAFESGHYSLSQLWLRRTAIHAPSEDVQRRLADDYGLLRRLNPWSLRIRADLRPSDNVNNGSDTSLNIIDGVPDGGKINGSALALSGMIASLDLAPAYRLRSDGASVTTLGARLYIERVKLSGAAASIAPRTTASDFASTYASVSLAHGVSAGQPGAGGAAQVALSLGESWYGGARSFRFARLDAQRRWNLGDAARLDLRALLERRYMAAYASNDARIVELGADFDKPLGNGDSLTISFALRESRAKFVNGSYSAASIYAEYGFEQPIGPARLSLGLVLGFTRYDTYVASVFLPPSQRTDRSAYGDVSLIFDRLDYAGFVPTLRLRSGRKTSNFSRFSSRETSISLGISSRF
jgi:hypothetical protein